MNMMVSRFGVYNTLPVYIDEITNIDEKLLSELVYKITDGRDKGRLTKSAIERKDFNSWRTLAIMSSNASLMDRLQGFKGHANAELNRLFEFNVNKGFTAAEGKLIAGIVDTNYGIVGREYARWLAVNQAKLPEKLGKISDVIQGKSDASPDERFWCMTGAVAVYGAAIAYNLGLSHIKWESILEWVIYAIREMKAFKTVHKFDGSAFLAAFLNKNANNGLVMASYSPSTRYAQRTYREPKGALVYRVEIDKKRLWISEAALREAISKYQVSINKLATDLRKKGLITTNKKISLSKGSMITGNIQKTWEFDLGHPVFGEVNMSIMSENNDFLEDQK